MIGPASADPDILERAALVQAAQRAAGIIAARHRGDPDGVRDLFASFPDDRALAGGSLLLAQLALGLYAESTDQDLATCEQQLTADLERSIGPV